MESKINEQKYWVKSPYMKHMMDIWWDEEKDMYSISD
jgi:hypothetical protein